MQSFLNPLYRTFSKNNYLNRRKSFLFDSWLHLNCISSNFMYWKGSYKWSRLLLDTIKCKRSDLDKNSYWLKQWTYPSFEYFHVIWKSCWFIIVMIWKILKRYVQIWFCTSIGVHCYLNLPFMSDVYSWKYLTSDKIVVVRHHHIRI